MNKLVRGQFGVYTYRLSRLYTLVLDKEDFYSFNSKNISLAHLT